jgi:hypothetical protein
MALWFAGCGDNGPAPGSVQLAWKLGFGVACNDARAGIDTIRVRFFQPATNQELKQYNKDFSCSSSTGIVPMVPVNTYNLTVEGGNAANFVASFTASVPAVVVKTGATLNLGTVVLEKVPPMEQAGNLQVSWTFQTGLCGANNVSNVQLQVWRDLVYKQHDKIYPCDIPAPGYVSLDVPAGGYGIIATGLDATGKIVRIGEAPARPTDPPVMVDMNQTTSLTGTSAIVLGPAS